MPELHGRGQGVERSGLFHSYLHTFTLKPCCCKNVACRCRARILMTAYVVPKPVTFSINNAGSDILRTQAVRINTPTYTHIQAFELCTGNNLDGTLTVQAVYLK